MTLFLTVNYRSDARESRLNFKNRREVKSAAPQLFEENNVVVYLSEQKIITEAALPINAENYYFVENNKVYELNLKTKQISEYAEKLPVISEKWLMVNPNEHIVTIHY